MINTIPLIDDERYFSQLGGEFNKLLQSDIDRNLIDPIRKNPPVNVNQKSTIVYGDGIANQGLIFQNNYDLSDNQLLTESQSEQILDNMSVNRPYTADENEMRILQNFDLDPQIRQLLVAESTKNKDNIYAQESQDFVSEVQKDLQAYIKERDLYSLGVEPIERLQLKLEQEELSKILKERPDISEKSTLRKIAELLTKTKGISLSDALLQADDILKSKRLEKVEKLAKRKAKEELITRQRAGVKDFEPRQEERLVRDEL